MGRATTWPRMLARVLAMIAFLAFCLFLPAGRLDWPEAWIFVTIYSAIPASVAPWLRRHDPALLEKRMTLWKPSVPAWDKAIVALSSAALVGLLVVAGLDARVGWSRVPRALEAVAFLVVVLAYVVFVAILRVNPFLSRFAEIQPGQRVVTTGPYRVVRHPMYASFGLQMLAIPVALGSWPALVPAVFLVGLLVLRTKKEDAMLRAGLAEYGAYAERTRYRLVPGVW